MAEARSCPQTNQDLVSFQHQMKGRSDASLLFAPIYSPRKRIAVSQQQQEQHWSSVDQQSSICPAQSPPSSRPLKVQASGIVCCSYPAWEGLFPTRPSGPD